MGLRLQDEVQFVASLGSIMANCLKANKATFCQRYQQVMSFITLASLASNAASLCQCSLSAATPQGLSFRIEG